MFSLVSGGAGLLGSLSHFAVFSVVSFVEMLYL